MASPIRYPVNATDQVGAIAVYAGAASFDPEARVTPTSFDTATVPNARGFFLGDYEGLANDATVTP